MQARIKRVKLTHFVTPIALICLALSGLVLVPAGSRVLAQSARRTHSSSYGDDIGDAISIGVLGLFHPLEFAVSAPAGSALIVHAGEQLFVLEKSSGLDAATVRISGGDLVVSAGGRVVRASKLTVSGRDGEAVDFVLTVPGKILRRYHGTLEIKPSAGILTAVVTIDRETAVGSIVAAESSPEAPLEALKSQAVATRSYLAAGARHHDFDFCDTTHCQFLREPPVPGSAAARAVAATRGLVLAYDSRPIAAMYTRSCSGRTRTPAESGLSAAAYPYFAVECAYCRVHPVRWWRRISVPEAASLRPSDEPSRLNLARRLGWSAVPSNDFVLRNDDGQVLIEGRGEGHGIGLCQSGAKAMAESGAEFRQILSHYYPNTTIVSWPGRGAANAGSR